MKVEVNQIVEKYQEIFNSISKKCELIEDEIKTLPCLKKIGCNLCCQQLFPLYFIEAYYLNIGFKKLSPEKQKPLIKIATLLKEHLQSFPIFEHEGYNLDAQELINKQNKITLILNNSKIPCPLLDKDGGCTLYEYRNHDCRIHGYSIDPENDEIVACPKFTPEIIKNLKGKLFDHNYLYREKTHLDKTLLQIITKENIPVNSYYFTTLTEPFLKDYDKIDWLKFIQDKFPNKKHKELKNIFITDF